MSKRTVELELATPGLDARGQPVRVPLGVAAAPGASDVAPPEPDLSGEHMLINLGPQHPATPGVLRPEVAQHVLARKVRLRRRDVAGAGSGRDTERHADRLTPGVQAGGRQLELDGALAHSESGSLPRSPRRSRSFMSAGSSSYASAMDNSSIE